MDMLSGVRFLLWNVECIFSGPNRTLSVSEREKWEGSAATLIMASLP